MGPVSYTHLMVGYFAVVANPRKVGLQLHVLKTAGATVFDLGTTVAASEIADTLIETGSKIVAISTYNGMAYSFGKALTENLEGAGLEDVKIIMGGRLNEPMDGGDLPEDVTAQLKEMGINTDNDVDSIVGTIAAMAN